MDLPNASKAFVDIRKLIEYSLDFDSPRGRHKARVFKAVLGIEVNDAELLKKLILESVFSGDYILGELDFYGQRYSGRCKIEFGGKSATIQTRWIVRRDEDFPRLTSVFVSKKELKDDNV